MATSVDTKTLNEDNVIEVIEHKWFKKISSCEYNIWLSKSIGADLEYYFDLFDFLENQVTKNDTVYIKLANYGGDLHTGIALAHCIQSCPAIVVMQVMSNCYSMAALLALCGDSMQIYIGNYLMFHNYSGGEYGKAGEIGPAHEANQKAWQDYLNYFCAPFLTKREINAILNDIDVYVHHDDKGLKNRIKRHFGY